MERSVSRHTSRISVVVFDILLVRLMIGSGASERSPASVTPLNSNISPANRLAEPAETKAAVVFSGRITAEWALGVVLFTLTTLPSIPLEEILTTSFTRHGDCVPLLK